MMNISIKLLNEHAVMPSYAHVDDAGMDLYACEEIAIQPNARGQVRTGIAVAIPDGYVGLVWDKSGISHKIGLKVMGGVIDAGYRGEILVGVVNLGNSSHAFNVGDKIAQMLIQKVEHPELIEVTELDTTVRGDKGFGSTGT